MVTPILRYINNSNSEELQKQYKEEGITVDPSKTSYHLIPDWEGDHLKAFNLKDAKEFITFITYKDKVHAVLDQKDKDYADQFFKTVKKLSASFKAGKK